MHLHKHDSFVIARDCFSLSAQTRHHLAPFACSTTPGAPAHMVHGEAGNGQVEPHLKMAATFVEGNILCQLPRLQRWTQGSWHKLGWPWWFFSSSTHARGRGGELLCT